MMSNITSFRGPLSRMLNHTNHSTKLCDPFRYTNSFTVYGLLFPIVSMVTVVTNCLIIFVFVKRRMRSPTTVLLVGLAVTDAGAAAVSVPLYLYLYGLGYEEENLSYPMCIYHDYSYIVSNILHTASAWITTTLAVQRYIVVAHPFRGPRLCTIRKSYAAVIVVFVAAPIMYIPMFMYRNYFRVTVYDQGEWISTCYCPLSGVEVYEGTLVVLKSAFAKIIPCLILITTTFALLRKLEVETDRILRLHAEDESEGERRDFRHIRRTSIMVTLIVITFLLVEIPSTVKVIVTKANENAIEKKNDYTVSMYINLCLLISYHVNFWIYVSLSQHFRRCLLSLCQGKVMPRPEATEMRLHTSEAPLTVYSVETVRRK